MSRAGMSIVIEGVFYSAPRRAAIDDPSAPLARSSRAASASSAPDEIVARRIAHDATSLNCAIESATLARDMNRAREEALTRVGQTLCKKWTLDRLIATGGMAAVYAATHRNGKVVAVKILRSTFAKDAHVRERFLREGYVANRVNHPGAVSVLDDDATDDGAPFLVMELLEGESLQDWLRRTSRLTGGEVLALAEQTLEVLALAHDRQIVHRDIKPGNLFCTKEGVLKVLDFGIARVLDGKHLSTADGVVLGTAEYMAPEQAQGKPQLVDNRSDLYALGAVMFHALSGRYVHDFPTTQTRLVAAATTAARKTTDVLPRVPPLVAETIDRALCFEKEGRWPDARTMRSAVRAAFEVLRDTPNLGEPMVDPSEVISLDENPSLLITVSFTAESEKL
jgi:eukaryotic-like serine/threonine-protein kinase